MGDISTYLDRFLRSEWFPALQNFADWLMYVEWPGQCDQVTLTYTTVYKRHTKVFIRKWWIFLDYI